MASETMTEERLARVILEWWRGGPRSRARLAEITDHYLQVWPGFDADQVRRVVGEWSHYADCIQRTSGAAVECDCGVTS